LTCREQRNRRRGSDGFNAASQMIQGSIRTESAISQAPVTFLQQHPDVTDADQIASAVAASVQKQQDEDLAGLVDKSCRQMSALLDVQPFTAPPLETPSTADPPKTRPNLEDLEASEPSPTHPMRTEETSQTELPQPSEATAPQKSHRRERTESRDPTPQGSRFRGSQSNEARATTLPEPAESAIASDGQERRSLPERTPKPPPEPPEGKPPEGTTSSRRTGPGAKRRPFDRPANEPPPELDPAEVESRRQFYIQQRDILLDQEARDGKGPRIRFVPPK
jgi:hypothetical protein